MSKSRVLRLAVAALLLALLGSLGMATAQEEPAVEGGAPMLVSYQGQVLVSGTPYTGTGYFKFAVVNLAGYTSYWSNDGSSTGGGEPATSVSLTVSSGLFNVLLGDTSLGGMTQPLAAGVFAGADRALRVWFSSDNATFTQMAPDRRIAAAPYALQAQEAVSAASAADADTLDGLHASEVVAGSAWTLAGNAGTDPASDFLGTTDAQPLVLRTNNAERLRVDASGRLGIGTASPSEMLTVDGNARVLNNDNPVLRGTAAVAGTGLKSVAVAGHYAYVVSVGSSLLAIYDISNPDNILALGSTTTNLSGPWSVAVAGRYAYVDSHDNHRLVIYDVSDPQNIAPKGYISTNLSYPDGLTVAGRYAYVVSDAGLAIYDVSDPDIIVAKGTTNAGLSYPNSVSVVGRYAYVTSESNDTLAIFDVSDPSSIVAKGTTTANLDAPSSVALAGRYAYVTSFYNNALAVFDVSNPSTIVPVGVTTANLDTPRSVAVAGGPGSTYAYVACDHTKRLAVFDVTDPGAIVAKGYASTSDGPMSVAVAGRHATVVQWNEVLSVFELNNLDAPTASVGSLHAGRLDVGESAVVGHSLDVQGSLSVGQGALFGGTVTAASLSVLGSPVWHAGNDGAGSTLDADLLDGSHASAFAAAGSAWSLAGNAGTTPGTDYLGTADNVALELKVNNVRALRLEPSGTSPNLLGGYSGNWLTSGVSGATIGGGGYSGNLNRVTDLYGTVGGGAANQAGDNAGAVEDEPYTTVGGGWNNVASGLASTVGGGAYNSATSDQATVAGGWGSNATGTGATVGGGSNHSASGSYATIGGGFVNIASNASATVSGGMTNTASGYMATVGGGYSNTASGSLSTVPGGNLCVAGGYYSFAAGRRAKANNQGCFVWADSTDADFSCSTDNLFAVRANGGVTFQTGTAAVLVNGNSVWHAGNDGTGSTLDADLLDGSHASAFSLSGHNHDAAYVNEGQADSITSSMILNGTLALADIGQNGCTSGQVMQWNGSSWACAAAGATDHGALTGLGDDDHPQYFALGQNEAVTGIPAFNGGTSGSTAPFSVDSNTLVTNLNADLLDGSHASAFAAAAHTHASLTPSTGLSGTAYNGGAPVSNWAVVYGTVAGSAVQGNQTATISAGNGLTGGVSSDALGDGFSATLNVGGGNGIAAAADALNLGPFTADWNQTGAFDLVLNNAGSELRILESAGAAYFGTFDVGDLGANQTYTFGTGGTVWTSGNDGTASTLDADLLDGNDSSFFSPATHNHDTAYWMQNGNSFGAVGRLGTNDNYALELEVNNNRILRLEHDFDSPNLIGGDDVNVVTSGAHGAVIAGGGYTSAYPNKVQDHFGVVGGGYNNRAGDSSDGDVADDPGATIGGGINNVAGAADSTIGGGIENDAAALGSTVGGGAYNAAAGQYATVPGGSNNTAAGAYTFAAGRRAKASADGCFVWGDSTNADITCSTANQFVARASGGVSFTGSNSFTINGNTAWHAGNDGAGSGLDADAVDGAHGPFFAQGGNSFGAVGRLGTNDNFALELEVNNTRALRIEPDATSPNWISGYSGNSVTGAYGATVGGGGASGAANSVTANFGTVPGGRAATASHYGEMAQAAGAFAAPGDAQASTYVLRNSTSDGTTWVPLYLDGSAAKLTLAPGRSMTFDILITAMASNGAAASYQYVGGIKRLSTGQITLLGGPAGLLVREDEAGWEVSIGADTSNNALDVVCKGADGRTIHWVAVVRTVETTMP